MEAIRVMVVDDDPDIRLATCRILSRAGWEVIEAADGEQALALARRERPGIVLLDVHLPGRDGFDVCREIRADPSLAGTMVVMLSGVMTGEEERVRGLRAGADGYIVRPVGRDELLARVEALVRIRATEARLRTAERLYRTLFQEAADPVVLCETDGGVVEANVAAATRFGWFADVVGRPLSGLVPPWLGAGLAAALREVATHGRARVDVDASGSDEGAGPTEILARQVGQDPVIVEVTIRELSEVRRRDAETQAQRRMQSLGVLARGLGHEINNPLNVVTNYLELLRDDCPNRGVHAEKIDAISEQVQRIAAIVRCLAELAWIRNPSGEPSDAIAAGELLRPGLLARIAGEGIRFEVEEQPGLPFVRCAVADVQQILIHLVLNAGDAIRSRGAEGQSVSGRIRIRARVVEKPGRSCVRISVEDDGPGIPFEVRDRVFEPFFTTRTRATHKGLGLSVSRGLAAEMGADLDLECAPDATRFHLDLPIVLQ